MYQEIIKKIKPEFDKTISFLDGEVGKIRTGRASVSLVENILVDFFGQKLPLKQMATISIAGPRQIIIQPWDKSYMDALLFALSQTSFGASPIVDQNFIRITLPAPSEEFRKEILKILSEKMEQARKTLRHWRERAWEEIQRGFHEGKIREDDKFKGKEELQKLVDEYQEKIEEIEERKKKEILE